MPERKAAQPAGSQARVWTHGERAHPVRDLWADQRKRAAHQPAERRQRPRRQLRGVAHPAEAARRVARGVRHDHRRAAAEKADDYTQRHLQSRIASRLQYTDATAPSVSSCLCCRRHAISLCIAQASSQACSVPPCAQAEGAVSTALSRREAHLGERERERVWHAQRRLAAEADACRHRGQHARDEHRGYLHIGGGGSVAAVV